MISEALTDLADVAVRAALAVLRRVGAATGGSSLLAQVVREGAAYHRLKLSQVFVAEPPGVLEQVADFDIDRLLADARAGQETADVRRYRLPQPMTRHFVLTDRQRATLRTYVEEMGSTTAAFGWLLTKVRMPDIVRQVRMTASSSGPLDAEPPRSDAVTP